MLLEENLQKFFGFGTFREPQREIISTLVEQQKDVVAVMPTGAGKSLCYQLPACMLNGVTIVISPLIALMKDQVDSLNERGISAAFINSSQTMGEQNDRLQGLQNGDIKIVFVAPERFNNANFLDSIRDLEISLLAIDEAHCISQWGHDFRPDYQKLGEIRESLGNPLTIALTATATPDVQDEIQQQLRLQDAVRIVSGFKRPNLFFEVIACSDEQKFRKIAEILLELRGTPSVIYCATRREVEEVRNRLNHMGFLVGAYHGGLSDTVRQRVQDSWMSSDIHCLVATNAFGMGVDKKDVRVVIHYKMSGSLEAYYQEAGRAGRDGKPSRCVLMYNRDDESIHKFFARNANPAHQTILFLWRIIGSRGPSQQVWSSRDLANAVNELAVRDAPNQEARRAAKKEPVHPAQIESAFKILEDAGHMKVVAHDNLFDIEILDQVKPLYLRLNWDQLARRYNIVFGQLWDIKGYINSQHCRQRLFIRHFKGSDPTDFRCNHCDNCYMGEQIVLEKQVLTDVETRLGDTGPDVTVQKLLCAVIRAKGRGTLVSIAAMLRGSNSIRTRELGFDKLSTYGLYPDLYAFELVAMLKRLILDGLVTRQHGQTLVATPRGWEVAVGHERIDWDGIEDAHKIMI